MTIAYLVLMYGIILLPIIFLFAYMPYLMRKKICFGVRIPEKAFDSEGITSIRKTYIKQVVVGGILIVFVSLSAALLIGIETTMYLQSAFIIGYIVVVYSAYIRAWKKVKTLKAEEKWLENATNIAVATTSTERIGFSASPVWFLLHVMVLAFTLIIGLMFYDQMPELVALNYDLNGNPVGFAEKSMKLLFFAPSIQLFLLLLFGFIYVVILKTKRNIDEDHIEESIEQNRIFKNRWLMFSIFGGLVMMLLFTTMQLTFVGLFTDMTMIFIATIVAVGFMIGMVTIIAIRTGQSGSRVHLVKNDNNSEIINRDDDKYWKLGMFYYNKDDPSLFVEKRFGVGFTNNFAHPFAWVFLLILLAIIVGSIVASLSFA